MNTRAMLVRAFSVVLVVILSTSGTSSVLADEDPYYVVNETYALSAEKIGATHHIIAFLPRRHLLYIDDRRNKYTIAGEEYVFAKTQGGWDAYILSSDVSKNPFNISIGSHEIIFNAPALLCKSNICDPDTEAGYWRIAQGDAFKIAHEVNGTLELHGGDEIVGHISEKSLQYLIDRGHVTRTDQPHPRYLVSKETVEILGTECGQHSPSSVRLDGGDLESIKKILQGFELGHLEGSEYLMITNRFGGERRKIEFRIYSIEDRWRVISGENQERYEKFFAIAIFDYSCEPGEFGDDNLLYINSLRIWSSRSTEHFTLRIEDEEFRTPTNMLEYTKAPYLISINSYDHYLSVIESLSEKLGDRSLAGYTISEINRSCGSRDRADNCRHYSYPR